MPQVGLPNDGLIKKHGLLDKQADILDLVMELFSGGSSPELPSVDSNEKRPKVNCTVGSSSSGSGSLNFYMEPLYTLLDCINDTYHFISSSSLKLSKSSRDQTTPP